VIMDVEAVSHDKLDRLKPCICGCRFFYLDDKVNWQCSRCKPPRTGAIHLALDHDVVRQIFDGRQAAAAEWPHWNNLLVSLPTDPHMRIPSFVAAVKGLAGDDGTPPENLYHAEERNGQSVSPELKIMVK